MAEVAQGTAGTASRIRPKYRIEIKNPTYCKACTICVDLCPKKSLGLDPETRRVELTHAETCNGCGLCEFICPDFVLQLIDNE